MKEKSSIQKFLVFFEKNYKVTHTMLTLLIYFSLIYVVINAIKFIDAGNTPLFCSILCCAFLYIIAIFRFINTNYVILCENTFNCNLFIDPKYIIAETFFYQFVWFLIGLLWFLVSLITLLALPPTTIPYSIIHVSNLLLTVLHIIMVLYTMNELIAFKKKNITLFYIWKDICYYADNLILEFIKNSKDLKDSLEENDETHLVYEFSEKLMMHSNWNKIDAKLRHKIFSQSINKLLTNTRDITKINYSKSIAKIISDFCLNHYI